MVSPGVIPGVLLGTDKGPDDGAKRRSYESAESCENQHRLAL